MANPIVLVPARMSSTRLPGKPLADIWGEPMIVHVWRRAMEADVGPVLVAADDRAHRRGGDGGRRPRDADPGRSRLRLRPHLRGADGASIRTGGTTCRQRPGRSADDRRARRCAPRSAPLADRDVDIATLATEIRRAEERDDPNVVKAVGTRVAPGRLRALYFTRARAPWGEGPLLHHIGLYAYRRAALARFVALPPSPLERRERLEQLRALEAGMRIDIALVDVAPLGVDTPEDLRRAREMLAPKGTT